MNIPQTIRVGGIDYRIERRCDLNDGEVMLFGQVDYHQCRIRLNPNYDQQLQAVTLLHEIFHILFHQADIDLGEQEEKIIDTAAYGIYQTLIDNHDLLWPKED